MPATQKGPHMVAIGPFCLRNFHPPSKEAGFFFGPVENVKNDAPDLIEHTAVQASLI
jgi:hypothetical protein